MKVLCFGDEIGLNILRDSIPKELICGIVVAEGRDAALPVASLWSKDISVPYMIQAKEKDGEKYRSFVDWYKGLKPIMGVICCYSLILTEEIVNIPLKGIFNIHGGLLPKYRGANVLNWVLINGETETGVTIHKVTKDVDVGDIVAMKKVSIGFNDTALTLREKLKNATIALIKASWGLLNKNPIPVYPQDESRAKTWRRRKPEDGLINWNRPAIEIYNLIRALVAPWPGAFYFDENGQKVVIDYFLSLEAVKELQKKQIGYVISNR